MLVASTLGIVCRLIDAFVAAAEGGKIVIVRLKDRWSQPAPGGWRDLLINFYISSDPNRHICEAQITHAELLMARTGLAGHHVCEQLRDSSKKPRIRTD